MVSASAGVGLGHQWQLNISLAGEANKTIGRACLANLNELLVDIIEGLMESRPCGTFKSSNGQILQEQNIRKLEPR